MEAAERALNAFQTSSLDDSPLNVFPTCEIIRIEVRIFVLSAWKIIFQMGQIGSSDRLSIYSDRQTSSETAEKDEHTNKWNIKNTEENISFTWISFLPIKSQFQVSSSLLV